MMQARSPAPGTMPVLHRVASLKLPPTALDHVALHCELNSDHPCFPLVAPTATTDVIGPPAVGMGTMNDPLIAPLPLAVTVFSSCPAGELACSDTDSFGS